MEQDNSSIDRINKWREINRDRIVKGWGGKANKCYIIALTALLCALVTYILIVGIDHVIEQRMGLLSICFTNFFLLLFECLKRRQAKKILKERALEAEKAEKNNEAV